MEPRGGKLYPLYEMFIPLDHTYPANVYSVHIFMWADTGEISVIQASSRLGDITEPIPEFPSHTLLFIFLVAILSVIVVRRKFFSQTR